MPQYKIYAVEPMGFPTVPLIVTTVYANPGGYPRAEWFLAIPDDESTLFATRIKYSVKSFPPGPFELNEDLMLREALDQATLQLRSYLFKMRKTDSPVSGFRTPDIREENKNLFMHYWIRGECLTQIEKITATTEFVPLKDDLDHVRSLPKLIRTDL